MKNTVKLLGLIAIIALIGFSLTACPEEVISMTVNSTNGTLTISGLGEWNGKYVYGSGFLNDVGQFYAYANIQAGDFSPDVSPNVILGQIQNGTITLKVWKGKKDPSNGEVLSDYKGNDKGVKFSFHIHERSNGTLWEVPDYITGNNLPDVDFTNGSGTVVYVEP